MDSPVNNKQVSRTDKKMLPLVLVKQLRDALPEMDNNPLLQSGGRVSDLVLPFCL